MDELKERILALVNGAKKSTLDRKSIGVKLNMTGSRDFALLDRTLDQLEEEAWLFRGPKNTYRTREQIHAVEGILKINRKGVGYVDRDGESSVLIREEAQNTALNGDTVLVRVTDQGDEEEPALGKVLKVTKRAKTTLVGTLQVYPRAIRFTPDEEKMREKNLAVHFPADAKLVSGEKVVMQIEDYGDPMELSYLRSIGHKDDPGVDILSILYDHEIDPVFPDEVMKQAESFAQTVSEEELTGRKDLTRVPTVTIDGDDSKDFDDAVAVHTTEDGWLLQVSIADVGHYVTEGSPLDLEAYERGCSTYAVNTVVPMLPHILSNGICSLNPGVVRLTNTCEMQVKRDGTISSYRVFASYIQSFERMTYNNVNKILDGDETLIEQYAHMGTLFTDLRDCADAIRARRVAQGAIDFDTSESAIILDDRGHVVDVHPRERGHAECMIEDCMIAANVCVADLMNKHDFPAVYRIHAAPVEKRLRDFCSLAYLLGAPFDLRASVTPKTVQQYLNEIKEDPEYPVLSMQMLRTMSKAVYDPKCLGHFGLAEQEYLHFTSPIRRYPDLLVHRMLRKYFYENVQDEYAADQKKMSDAAEQSSVRERISQDAEYDADDFKKAEFMLKHIGEQMEGLITSVTSFGFFVELPSTVEGLVRLDSLGDDYYRFDQAHMALVGSRSGRVYKLGQKVKVVVLSATPATKTVEFGIVAQRREPLHREFKTRSRAGRKNERFGGGSRDFSHSTERSARGSDRRGGKRREEKKEFTRREDRKSFARTGEKKEFTRREEGKDFGRKKPVGKKFAGKSNDRARGRRSANGRPEYKGKERRR